MIGFDLGELPSRIVLSGGLTWWTARWPRLQWVWCLPVFLDSLVVRISHEMKENRGSLLVSVGSVETQVSGKVVFVNREFLLVGSQRGGDPSEFQFLVFVAGRGFVAGQSRYRDVHPASSVSRGMA